ncbi:hypothetical protein [Spartinivicinus poritis]|uniref:Transmembrane anchor protein n=1 Tax=Spartinivicinus poritis TaxID=2994640 RepID=A0ABT5U6S0_9GAMM|nr:hypothetical protein [Spartinivicinus sp. A2-2]MDE1460874.1 hypothetical protein [Spartinivicinus sp. A2-2]
MQQDISNMNREGLPSNKSLLKATVVAFLVGALLLVTTILPAEYGLDPTGIGKQLGLTVLSSDHDSHSQPASSAPTLLATVSSVWKGKEALRNDTMSLTLGPNEGAEIKAKMVAGERFVFNWEVQGGEVSFDMHGERLNAGDEFTSYWVGRNQSSASGAFEAPFDGTHGWYWQNKGSEPVTVVVKTSGFYETLYQPE